MYLAKDCYEYEGMQVAMKSAICANSSLCRWHLVFTKPSSEKIAQINLERQGYKVYFPRMQRRVLRQGSWRESISALFPRYLFVQLNTAFQSLAPMRSTVGVAGVVRFGAEYIAVPEAVVRSLIGREDERGLHRLSLESIFQVGAAIRVIEGALAGIEGIFERESADDRVSVLLKILGRETSIRVPSASVVLAERN